MKTVAIVYRNLAGLSGVPNIVFAHAKALVDAGYTVDLIAEKLDMQRAVDTGAGYHLVKRLPGSRWWKRSRFARRADKLTEKYDFVVGHGHHFQQQVLTLHNCVQLANEYIFGADAVKPDVDARLQESIFGKGRYRFCAANSELMRHDLLQRYNVSDECMRVIYPGYNAERFNVDGRQLHKEQIRQQLRLTESQLLIGLITSGAFEKRAVDVFIQSVASLPVRIREMIKVLIAGKSSQPEYYRKMADELGLSGIVFFNTVVPDVERYFHALDIAVHPARFEEFGLTVVEAMACGVPVILNKRVGAAELLPAEARRELPEQVSVDGLREQLLGWIENPELRMRWRDYGLRSVTAVTMKRHLEKTLALYHEAGL